MIKIYLVFFQIFLSITAFSQANLELTKINKANSYLLLATDTKKENKEKALDFIDKAKKISLEINNDSLLRKIYYEEAHIYDFYGEYKKSYKLYEKAIEYSIKTNNYITAAKSYLNLGATDYYYGELEKAINHYEKSYNYFKSINDSVYIPKIYNNLSAIYKAKGNYVKAINYLQNSLKFYDNNIQGKATSYQNIGAIYWELENFSEALICYKKSETLYDKINNKSGLSDIYINMGLIYKQIKDTSLAFKYYDKAVIMSEITKNKKNLATAILNIGVLLDEIGNHKYAEKKYKESLKIFEEIEYKKGILTSLLNLSTIYSINNQIERAIIFAKKGLDIAKEINSLKYQMEAYKILAENYRKANKLEQSIENYKKFMSVKDSIFSVERSKQINEIRIKYETEKNKATIKLLRSAEENRDLIIKQEKNKLYIIISTLIFAIIFISLLFYLYFQKQKTHKIIGKKNIEIAKKDLKIEKLDKETNPQNNSNSNIDISQKNELLTGIINLMENDKYFLNPNLTIEDAAIQLNTNRAYLSRIINKEFNCNFNNFVNEYRIKEATKMLLSDEYNNYSLEGIASSVGFNNRATFITAFKKFTGVTPSFFQKKVDKTK